MITQTKKQPTTNAYRRRILAVLRQILTPHMPFSRALDFGSGDGLFAQLFAAERIVDEVVPVDVQRRKQCRVQTTVYDGKTLPFDDRTFDLVYAMDVLHHCDDPRASLRELMRCSSKFVLIKDHTFRKPLGRLTLGVLDEIGNRRFGVPCLYNYQREWEWSNWLGDNGFVVEDLRHPVGCHAGPLARWLNRLQFIGLWRREA